MSSASTPAALPAAPNGQAVLPLHDASRLSRLRKVLGWPEVPVGDVIAGLAVQTGQTGA